MNRPIRLTGILAGALLASCTGDITGPDGVGPGSPVGGLCSVPAPATKLVRLTHAQFDNTVHDLLNLTDSPSAMFQNDATFSGFNNNAEGLQVADRLGRDYRRAAEDLAAKVIATPASRSKVVPCTASTDACAADFIASFGRRAFRRPLTTVEQATFLDLFHGADELLDTGDAFSKGVQLTVEAMLQSPNFLYRVEVDEAAGPQGLAQLTPYEMASKLSYLLWNTMPDATLLDLAESGALTTADDLKAQAIRLISDPRAQSVVDDFHSQWLDLAHYDNLNHDPALFPAFSPSMSPMMKEETLRLVRAVVLQDKAPFSTLFTAPYTYANKEIAGLYKLPGTFTSTSWNKVMLDDTQRMGLLTQTGFLASRAYARTDSPIHRGVFVLRRILSLKQDDPPPGIDFTLPPVSATVRTTREQVTAKTDSASCSGCHTRINGVGFAFEHYDAVGQWRTQENGVDVDSSGHLVLGGSDRQFTDAVDLSMAIAASSDARRSYALNWLRYGYQRSELPTDACDLDSMSADLARPGASVIDLIVNLTQTPSFRLRPRESP